MPIVKLCYYTKRKYTGVEENVIRINETFSLFSLSIYFSI